MGKKEEQLYILFIQLFMVQRKMIAETLVVVCDFCLSDELNSIDYSLRMSWKRSQNCWNLKMRFVGSCYLFLSYSDVLLVTESQRFPLKMNHCASRPCFPKGKKVKLNSTRELPRGSPCLQMSQFLSNSD